VGRPLGQRQQHDAGDLPRDGSLANAWRPGATKVKEGVLTPPYEKAFRERRAEIDKYGEQRYDRLTNCEYPGVPALALGAVHQRVREHAESVVAHERYDERDAAHLYRQRARQHREQALAARRQHRLLGRPTSSTIWTKWVNPADYVRGMPLTSNQFEMVETWQERRAGDKRELVTQVTFYDPIGLVKPQQAGLRARVAARSRGSRRAHPHVGVHVEQQFVQGRRGQYAVLSARRSAVQRPARLYGLSGHPGAIVESRFSIQSSDMSKDDRCRRCGLVGIRRRTRASLVAMFDSGQHKLVEGTVTEWNYNNPHSWLVIEAPGADGKMTTWSFEGAAIVHAARQGVNGKSYAKGEHVRVVMHPLRDGRNAGALCFVIKETARSRAPTTASAIPMRCTRAGKRRVGSTSGKNLDTHPTAD
jgi:hypothetical protein